MKQEVLAIYGSPRKHGLSSLIHDAFLEPFAAAAVINKIYAYDEKIYPCNACGTCANEERCSIEDSMQKIYSLIKSADLISVSSPLYFSSVPGQLKNLIDRCEFFWENKIDHKVRNGIFFSAAGDIGYNNMFLPSVTVIRHFFKTIGCIYKENNFILLNGTDAMKKIPEEIIEIANKTGEIYLEKTRKS